MTTAQDAVALLTAVHAEDWKLVGRLLDDMNPRALATWLGWSLLDEIRHSGDDPEAVLRGAGLRFARALYLTDNPKETTP